MNRLIVISPLDRAYYDNSRVHHIVGQLRRRFDEVVLIHRRIPVTDGLSRWRRMFRFFRLHRDVRHDENVTRIAVTPIFARPHGTSFALLHVADSYEPVTGKHRRIAITLLSWAGLLLDLFCVPSYLFAYLKQGAPKADVTIAEGPWEFLAGRVLKLAGRTSRVVYDDIDYVPGSYTVSRFKRRVMKALENHSIRRADVVVSVGELLADLRRREIGREVVLVPNGADIEHFARAREKRPHPPTLIYVGSVLGWAGVDLTITALGRIRREIPDVRFLILGHSTADFQAFLHNLSKLHGVREHVHFLGKRSQDEVVDFLAEADIGMAVFRPVELRKYAFSLKIIEYMAAGMPVITTAGTQSEQVVLQHGSGIAVEFRAEAIADAVLLLLKDPGRYRSMVAKGTEASAEYSWSSLMLEHLYPALTVGGNGTTPANQRAMAGRRNPPAR